MQLRNLRGPQLAMFTVLAACASSGGRAGAPVEVDELNARIESVHIEAERARDAVADAFERLNTLAAGRFDQDPAPVLYARLVTSVDIAERQVVKFRDSVEPMMNSAEPVFQRRQEDIAKISSDSLRKRGEVRFQVDRERYQAIASVAVPAKDQFATFVQSLRDHTLFLGHDLNAGAIDAIQEDVKEVAKVALELDRRLEETMVTARAYVEQSSLPAAAPVGR